MSDLIIIGAGPGGYETALFAAQNGLQVMLIEEKEVGGVCLQEGCIPTKNYYQSAHLMEQMKKSSLFGFSNLSYSFDFAQMVNHKNEVVAFLTSQIKQQLKIANVDLRFGHADLIDAHHVLIGEEVVKASHIILALGSSNRELSIVGSKLERVYDSSSILQIKELPPHLIIVGGGVIGCEFASIFSALGSKVTLLEATTQLLPMMDQEVVKRLQVALKKAGIEILLEAKVERIDASGEERIVSLTTKGGKELQITADAVLLSIGRIPNVHHVSLEAAGIKFTSHGIQVNENFQTTAPNIYAIGDVTGQWMLAHCATFQGKRALAHILQEESEIRFDAVPSIVFTLPPIASVGKKESDLVVGEYLVAKGLYAGNGIAQSSGETFGFVKILADLNHRILGVHMIGSHANDMIAEATLAVQQHYTVEQYQSVIHAHPTMSEVIQDALFHIK